MTHFNARSSRYQRTCSSVRDFNKDELFEIFIILRAEKRKQCGGDRKEMKKWEREIKTKANDDPEFLYRDFNAVLRKYDDKTFPYKPRHLRIAYMPLEEAGLNDAIK